MFGADAKFGPPSRDAVRACLAEGSLIACDVVWAEVAGSFSSPKAANEAMEQLGVGFSPLALEATLAAGTSWSRYRRAGGTRQRVIADFLIAAHALDAAERLLTRDRGFYRRYFEKLRLVDPSVA